MGIKVDPGTVDAMKKLGKVVVLGLAEIIAATVIDHIRKTRDSSEPPPAGGKGAD